MNSRTLVTNIFNKENTSKPAFWTGQPTEETQRIYHEKMGIPADDMGFNHIPSYLNDDCRWIMSDWGSYKHPENKPVFDVTGGVEKTHHGQAGVFAECSDVKEVECYPWPDVKYLDFTHVYDTIDKYQDRAIFTGMWSSFFHNVADFFGMENYFMKMYTDPDVVQAVTDHVTDFYLEANEIFFSQLGDRADIMFFGNDFGTQRDLLISPAMFDRFVLPSFKKLISLGKKYNKKILLHSCGSIYKVIPKLIDAGIDGLHPLQAKAVGMDAETLGREYKKDICFVGGIDAQGLLVNGTPEETHDEVLRVREHLGSNFIVSASHEAILPNVPFENMVAMSKAAKE